MPRLVPDVPYDPDCPTCEQGYERDCMTGDYVRCSRSGCYDYTPPADAPQTVPTFEDCDECGGYGHVDGERLDVDLYAGAVCPECGGEGEVEVETFDRDEADLELERTDG